MGWGVQGGNVQSLKAEWTSRPDFSAVKEKRILISNVPIYYQNKRGIKYVGAFAFRNIGL